MLRKVETASKISSSSQALHAVGRIDVTAPAKPVSTIAPSLEGTVIRAGSMEGFRGLLLELGVAPGPVLEAAGLDENIIGKPEVLIPTRAYRRALNHAADATGISHFGLMLSQRQTFEKLGVVGYLVRHAPNLRISIERLIRHFHTHDTGSMNKIDGDGDAVLWMHRLAGVEDECAVQQTELAMGLGCRFVRSALGETWTPSVVYFEHAAPHDLQPYNAVFRCPVLFEQSLTAIELPASDLERPLRQSDSGLFAILEQHIERLGEGLDKNDANMVRQALQDGIEAGSFRIDDIARSLQIKRHVLQRKLKGEGTSFQAILDDVRYEIARRYLRETRTPISEIAGILGYAESAVFTRAFTRRSGATPSKWRKSHAIY